MTIIGAHDQRGGYSRLGEIFSCFDGALTGHICMMLLFPWSHLNLLTVTANTVAQRYNYSLFGLAKSRVATTLVMCANNHHCAVWVVLTSYNVF